MSGGRARPLWPPDGQPPRLTFLDRVLVGLDALLAVSAYLGAFGLITGGLDLGEVAAVQWRGLGRCQRHGPDGRRGWNTAAQAGHIVVGAGLTAWIVVQVAFIGLVMWLQPAFLDYGLLILALGVFNVRASGRTAGSGNGS